MVKFKIKMARCPVCKSYRTRKDYDFPETMRDCKKCGAEYISKTGEITLNPKTDV